MVRFVSAFACCDGGLPEGSDVHEAAGYILELHQPNVSSQWRTIQLSVFRRKLDRSLVAAIKERQRRRHE